MGTKMNLPIVANENVGSVRLFAGKSALASDSIPATVLMKFVRELATRQARIDAGLNLMAANDNEPRILQ
jgi:hypothetical protein